MPTRLRLAGGIVLGAVLGAAALGAIALLRARESLDRGAAAGQSALAAARNGNMAATLAALARSERDFEAGRRTLRAWWTRPAWVIPVDGANLRAADTMAGAGLELARTGRELFQAAQSVPAAPAGGTPLAEIGALDGPLVRGNATLSAVEGQLRRAGSAQLLPPVASRLAVIRAKVARLTRDTATLLGGERLAAAMLDGPAGARGNAAGAARHYFVAFTTPSELRGATGLIANYAEVAAEGGRVTIERFGRMEDLARLAPSRPDGLGWDPQYLAAYGPILSGSLWQNITVSPDFSVTAGAIESLYPHSGGSDVSGVVAVDPQGLAALLAVEGPITVAGWPGLISARNVAGILEHDQYDQFADLNRRVQFLTDLTSEAISRLNTTRVADLLRGGAAIGSAFEGKHIVVASDRAGEEDTLVRLGVAGSLPAPAGDVLGVFSVNASTNKTDWYLRRSINYQVTRAAGVVDATATITLRNNAPPSGEAPAILQGTPGAALPGHNHQILSLVTPWTFAGATVNETPSPVTEAAAGSLRLLSVMVDIPPQGTAVVTFRLEGVDRTGRYHLDLVRQPTAAPDALSLIVDAAGPDGRLTPTVTRSMSLSSDLHVP